MPEIRKFGERSFGKPRPILGCRATDGGGGGGGGTLDERNNQPYVSAALNSHIHRVKDLAGLEAGLDRLEKRKMTCPSQKSKTGSSVG